MKCEHCDGEVILKEICRKCGEWHSLAYNVNHIEKLLITANELTRILVDIEGIKSMDYRTIDYFNRLCECFKPFEIEG